jgi:hypothetical protein
VASTGLRSARGSVGSGLPRHRDRRVGEDGFVKEFEARASILRLVAADLDDLTIRATIVAIPGNSIHGPWPRVNVTAQRLAVLRPCRNSRRPTPIARPAMHLAGLPITNEQTPAREEHDEHD